jgi:hypothetical protein
MQVLTTGTLAGIGSFQCEGCGYALAMEAADHLPACPSCGGGSFIRSSLFGTRILSEGLEEPVFRAPWADEAREAVEVAGAYLAYERPDGTIQVFALDKEWTRIGRSLAADVRFDDPTVSRRHALVVRGPDGVRVLDDRSLNGVFVNGERVEWRTLADGDAVSVGRHQLSFLEVEEASISRRAAGATAA